MHELCVKDKNEPNYKQQTNESTFLLHGVKIVWGFIESSWTTWKQNACTKQDSLGGWFWIALLHDGTIIMMPAMHWNSLAIQMCSRWSKLIVHVLLSCLACQTTSVCYGLIQQVSSNYWWVLRYSHWNSLEVHAICRLSLLTVAKEYTVGQWISDHYSLRSIRGLRFSPPPLLL